MISTIINYFPFINKVHQKLKSLDNTCYLPGHYYSPIISIKDIKHRQEKIWPPCSNHKENESLGGIDFNTDQQLSLVNDFSKNYYAEIPFKKDNHLEARYYFNNDYFSYTDGIILYSMLRHFKPSNVIEVGSGFSSALMLDVNELFFDNKINLSFIEPYTDRLYSLMTEKDKQKTNVIDKPIQEVELNVFKSLEKDDVLFIDSTHVVKTGSDVNFILFEILPILKSGVLIHFHDIFYPFEYPKKWVFKGRNWNENYFLRSFLMYNDCFEMILFADYLHKVHSECFANMPLTYNNTGGNLWLRKK